ncbi:MAG: acetylglutamate kinase [Clostridia bacterium]|nr:acetylglutamate kinase [Clostridia bacterium]
MERNFSNAERAEVLTQALPHIQKYAGKIVVIKYGGNAMVNEAIREQVMQDMVLLRQVGVRVVLVHGGGPEITAMMNALGKEARFIDGLRVTDQETVDIVQMVLAGKINKTLVGLIGAKGGRAIGLSGLDDQLIVARQKDEKLGFVGDIVRVNTQPILDLLDRGYIPVVSTLGVGDKGEVYNINGDTAAACLAGALHAERMILMTDIAGLLRDPSDPGTLIPDITLSDAMDLMASGVISGGMIPKVECCIRAINEGVHRVIIMDGRVPHSILMELLTNEGAGTMVRKEDLP